jgi:hypothetical protein
MQYEDRPDSEIPYILKCCNPCAVFKGENWRSGPLDRKKDPTGYRYPGQDNFQTIGTTQRDRVIRFTDSVYGIVAGVWTVRNLHSKGFNTLRLMLNKYAPAEDGNKPEDYIRIVSTASKTPPEQVFDTTNEALMLALIRVIIRVECGPTPPKDLPRNWVPEGDIAFGVQMGMGKISTSAPLPPKPVIEQPRGPFPLTQAEQDNFLGGLKNLM